jgi:hypothetical protein
VLKTGGKGRNQRPFHGEGQIMLLEERSLQKISSAAPDNSTVGDDQFPMVKSKKGVSIANDFHIAIPGQLADGAVDVLFVPGSGLAEAQIAAAID